MNNPNFGEWLQKYLAILLCSAIFSVSSYAADINFETLELESTNTAPFFPKFKLIPDSERKSLEELRSLGADHIDENRLQAIITGPLPSSVDLSPNFDPIYNQLNLGSCTANALIAAINFNKKGMNPKSRLFLYAQERMMEHPIGSLDEDSGASLSDGILALRKVGVCDEAYWPYGSGTSFHTPPVSFPNNANEESKLNLAFQHWSEMYRNAAECRLANLYVNRDFDPKHTSSVAPDVTTIKTLLSRNAPIVGGIVLYSSFMNMGGSAIVPMPKSTDTMLGGHAIVFAGYNDNKDLGNGKKGAFFIRNSWGPDWGTNFSGTGSSKGYFWLPYDYVTSNSTGRSSPLVVDLWKVGEVGQTYTANTSGLGISAPSAISQPTRSLAITRTHVLNIFWNYVDSWVKYFRFW